MRLDQIHYRFRQFWQALYAVPDPADLALAQTILSPAQTELFLRLQVSEQAHSLRVFKRLYAQGERDPGEHLPDLLVAALLHDVGKSCHRLYLWERILIVIAKAIYPDSIHRWGSLPPGSGYGWRRAFVIAEQHPLWGAELSAAAGSSPLVVALIRRHQETPVQSPDSIEDKLLARLQAADGSH